MLDFPEKNNKDKCSYESISSQSSLMIHLKCVVVSDGDPSLCLYILVILGFHVLRTIKDVCPTNVKGHITTLPCSGRTACNR